MVIVDFGRDDVLTGSIQWALPHRSRTGLSVGFLWKAHRPLFLAITNAGHAGRVNGPLLFVLALVRDYYGSHPPLRHVLLVGVVQYLIKIRIYDGLLGGGRQGGIRII